MADLVIGAMGSLVPKLGELLKEEYNLQTDVKERIKFLTRELDSTQAALRKVSQVPWDQLDEQVRIWAREVRESSYDMEDVLDTFLVRVEGKDDSLKQEGSLKRLGERMTSLFKKTKARRKISVGVKDIMSHLDEVTERCRRYKVDDIVATPAATSTIDPRLSAMYNKVKNLVGIDKPSGDLISKLQHHPQKDGVPSTKMKIVSVVGVGGLGKTTLAKAVYDKLKGDFDHGAFVSVGRNPDLMKVIQGVLIELDKKKYMKFNFGLFHQISQFINELREFLLENKRYFIVIDDIWEIESWETIKLAIDDDNNYVGRIIITTRKLEVAIKATDEVYKLQPLTYDSSRELFHARIFGDGGTYVDNQQNEVYDKILKKCGGIPLAIITMASLLVGKPSDKWSELYKSIGFGQKDNKDAAMAKILSFSYYDLPSHLRTCLLYLSAFPEDSVIPKDVLVWKWVAEGFIHEKRGISLCEIGEGYFNDLINKSLIQAVESDDDGSINGCRVHDMVLDFIRSMSGEENFFTVLDTNDQGRLLLSNNARRLAHHNLTMGQTHPANNSDGVLPKVRSFMAHGCVIETWVSVSSFTLLRVLAIQDCKPRDGSSIRVEHLGRLLHLRYLSLMNTRVDKISEEIGTLKFLQTLDLRRTYISEPPLSFSLLSQLVCLKISFRLGLGIEAISLERLTSLEELTVNDRCIVVKELGSLRELRVLQAFVRNYDEESEKDLVESLRHLHKLQHLRISTYVSSNNYRATWEATGFVLPRHLRHLALRGAIVFSKLPSCINPWSLPNLSHLDLILEQVDGQDLKILGGLPELRSLRLELGSLSSATISDIDGDNEAGYFLKLRVLRVNGSMAVLIANKESKSVSFHLWDGEDNIISMPFGSNDELQCCCDNDYDESESQRPIIPSISDVDELQYTQPRELQHGLAALAYYYLLAFFQHVLAFVAKRWPFISDRGSGDIIARPSASGSSDYEDKGTKAAAGLVRFMPSLQVLQFEVHGKALRDHRYCNNLGWEYLSSLREIIVFINPTYAAEKVEAALKRAANVHPNRPTLRIDRFWS